MYISTDTEIELILSYCLFISSYHHRTWFFSLLYNQFISSSFTRGLLMFYIITETRNFIIFSLCFNHILLSHLFNGILEINTAFSTC